MKITALTAREILDSRGFPTLEVEVTLEDGVKALGQVPSGASTGATEAYELRDDDPHRYHGYGVLQARSHVIELASTIVGQDAYDQAGIDRLLCEADGTERKERYGGNALLGISMAVCRAAARSQGIPLYEYFAALSGGIEPTLPTPLVLMIEGGKHGNWATDIQEFMITPKQGVFGSFAEQLRVSTEIYHSLHDILLHRDLATGVGLEGAFCPPGLNSNEDAFNVIREAIMVAGYMPGGQVGMAVDVASSSFYHDGGYVLHSEGGVEVDTITWAQKMFHWIERYPLWSVEDPFHEEAWEDWSQFNSYVGGKVKVVGDDLLTTNTLRIQHAVDVGAVNSVLIKPNQIGTITETLEAISLAVDNGLTCMISHRGGETNDDLIADLAVGSAATHCKFGSPARGERVAKYNRLLRIESATGTV